MFGTVLTIGVTLLYAYVFVRLATLRLRGRRISLRLVIGLGAGLWLVFFVGRVLGGQGRGLLPLLLEMASMHAMGTVFLMAVAMFVSDLACGYGFLFRGAANRIRWAGVICGVAMALFAHVQGFRPPVVERYEVAVADLPASLDGTTIVAMADFHAGEMFIGPRWIGARVAQVRALRPDCIVFVGDIFERAVDVEAVTPVMRQFSAPLGVYVVRGNHDRVRGNRRDFLGDIAAGAGIRLLANESVAVADGLVLAGVDDLTSSRRRGGEGEANLGRALADRSVGATVLLSHTPWLTDLAAADGVDVMISAHAHGGQIWPFNHLVALRYPYVQGRYDVGGMSLIVTRGTGTWGPRMRLWPPGEITHITLRAGK